MSSRESILKNVKEAQPPTVQLPKALPEQPKSAGFELFQEVLESLGGRVIFVDNYETIRHQIVSLFPNTGKILSLGDGIEQFSFKNDGTSDCFRDVEVVIIDALFGVAENGSVWITEEEMKIRVLPFICEHLVAVLSVNHIVSTMQDAYRMIGDSDYGFGVFIAGPSKTADIEQSLVLGAHGPKTMTVIVKV